MTKGVEVIVDLPFYVSLAKKKKIFNLELPSLKTFHYFPGMSGLSTHFLKLSDQYMTTKMTINQSINELSDQYMTPKMTRNQSMN